MGLGTAVKLWMLGGYDYPIRQLRDPEPHRPRIPVKFWKLVADYLKSKIDD